MMIETCKECGQRIKKLSEYCGASYIDNVDYIYFPSYKLVCVENFSTFTRRFRIVKRWNEYYVETWKLWWPFWEKYSYQWICGYDNMIKNTILFKSTKEAREWMEQKFKENRINKKTVVEYL